MLSHQDFGFSQQNPTQTLNTHLSWFVFYYFPFQFFLINLFLTEECLLYRILLVSVKPQHESIPDFHGLPSCLQFAPSHFHPQSGYPSIPGKCLLPLALDSTHSLRGNPPHLSTQTLSEISLWISFTKSRQALLSSILWPTKVVWTGGEDRQISGSRARRRL